MPLHLAAMCGNDFAVEQLLVKGADCNAKDKYDNTPLHLAASKGGAKVTQLLLSVGAEPFAKNHFQLTPSDYAKNMDYQNLVKKQQTILEQGLKRAPFTIRVLQQTIEQQAMQLGQQEQRLAQQQQEMQQLKTQMSDLMILINQTKMSYEKKSNKHYKLTLFPK